ncbi:Glyoxylate/hydroxypyruvate reductase B (plasmid) [Rhodococcus ruber]|uniref:NAD(P)-dependent oxidoreductase n=1 Tax=Rhodococcus ruber TaxID=1830 RepID=UPI00315DEFC9
MSNKFRVGVTRDVLGADGRPFFDDLGLELLDDHPRVDWEILPERVDVISPQHTADYDGLLLLAPRVTRASFGPASRTAVIARFGVGYDSVDVDACTDAGVALTITPDAVRRPVASAMVAMVLGLAHRVRERDLQVREGRWSEKFTVVGTGLTGRTVGLVGLGRIGAEFCRLLAPFEMKAVAYDPFADRERAAASGIEMVSLETLLSTSDFVCIAAPLTDSTHKLIGADALAMMKSSAYLVNAARGPIVDEEALVDSLRARRIAGAALDVFDPEPPTADNPLFALDNVVLTPHSIAHSDELYRACGRSAISALLAVADGLAPEHTVNRAVLTSETFRARVLRAGA